MTKPLLTKYTVVAVCLAPFLLPGLFVIGWIARYFATQRAPGEETELVPSLLLALLPSGAVYLVGMAFAIYALTVKSRYALQTLLVLSIASLVIGFVLYDALW